MPERESESPTAPARDQPRGGTALLIVDMINCFDFPGADQLIPKARCAARAILDLRLQADQAEVPVIYVNDNFGEWHSEKSRLVERAGVQLLDPAIAPRDGDYFVIKPQLSGFYSTNLAVLLPKLGVDRLVVTGVATDMCVLFTAADAYMRDYALWVPQDAVAAECNARGAAALAILERHLGAEIAATPDLALSAWTQRCRH